VCVCMCVCACVCVCVCVCVCAFAGAKMRGDNAVAGLLHGKILHFTGKTGLLGWNVGFFVLI